MHFSNTRYLLGLPHWEVLLALGTLWHWCGSQLLTGGEISFAKPVLRVRFTKHLPTL